MRMPIGRSDLRRQAGRHLGAAIAGSLEAAIDSGRLAPGERLPTVRALAVHLGVSPATVVGAYEQLAGRGRIRGEVGRGTYVRGPEPAAERLAAASARRTTEEPRRLGPGGGGGHIVAPGGPWRRRLQSQTTARLLAAHPGAVDCASGGPDASLLPIGVLRRAWGAAIEAMAPGDLQYSTPEPLPALAAAITTSLARDGIDATGRQIAVGASALQLMELSLRAAVRRAGWREPVVAVEQPGYATVLDAVDRLGWRMVGVAVDSHGAVPESLAAALGAGARITILTPRAQNPTGASWTAARRNALAAVLAHVPDAVAIEDDHAADASLTPSTSLITDPLLRSRVVHVRSFSKAFAPDLRVAIAVSGPSLRGLIVEEKGYVDGWTSRMAQRTLAGILRDAELPALVLRAAHAYAERRRAAIDALMGSELVPAGGSVTPAADGMNVWVTLPPGVDESSVLERVAACGWVMAPGECFHLRPGSCGQVRLTVSGLDVAAAAAAGAAVGSAAAELAGVGSAVGAAT